VFGCKQLVTIITFWRICVINKISSFSVTKTSTSTNATKNHRQITGFTTDKFPLMTDCEQGDNACESDWLTTASQSKAWYIRHATVSRDSKHTHFWVIHHSLANAMVNLSDIFEMSRFTLITNIVGLPKLKSILRINVEALEVNRSENWLGYQIRSLCPSMSKMRWKVLKLQSEQYLHKPLTTADVL